jgi:hypothetical protein
MRLFKLLAFCANLFQMGTAMHAIIALTSVLIAFAGSLTAQNRSTEFQLTKITRNLIASPEFNYSGAEIFRTNTRDRWLEVEVEFTAAPPLTDELSFKYYILLNGKLLTGEVTHVNIPAGRELRSVMYVSPRSVAHLMGNRPFTANSVENIAVQVSQQGAVKDELSLTRTRPQWFAALPPMSGFVLNKNETPFAPLYWDRYEQIKSR